MYTVGVVGVVAQLAIYELVSEPPAIDQVPGLIGPDELAEWQGNLFFTDGTLEVYGRRSKITPAASRHPCISLLDFSRWWHAEGDGGSPSILLL